MTYSKYMYAKYVLDKVIEAPQRPASRQASRGRNPVNGSSTFVCGFLQTHVVRLPDEVYFGRGKQRSNTSHCFWRRSYRHCTSLANEACFPIYHAVDKIMPGKPLNLGQNALERRGTEGTRQDYSSLHEYIPASTMTPISSYPSHL